MLEKRARFALTWSAASAIALAAAAACSSDENAGSSVAGGGNSGGVGAEGGAGGSPGGAAGASGASGASGVNGASGAGIGGAAGGIAIDGAGGSGARGDGGAEVCDGADNDGDGIIDDVDVGGDGVCDCLNIATIGQIGPWSNGGNIFTTWLNMRSPTGAVALDDQLLTADLIRPFQVIVSLHVDTTAVENMGRSSAAHHAFAQEEADALKAWVEGGGGFLTTIGYSNNEANEVVNVNRLLNALGMGYSTSKLDLTDFVQRWDPHPITMGVSRIFTDNGIQPEGTGTTIAWDTGDRVALQVKEVGMGRVAVWGDEWITYDSEWQDITDQQVELFWLNLLKWLSPPNECQVPIPPPR
jgi:hypothetical protein